MRKKAERKIRQAAARLGDRSRYRIDQVRAGAGLIQKVYDKTILDMARLGTIALSVGDISNMTTAEIGNLIYYGGRHYVYFQFLDADSAVENIEPETVDITLQGIEREQWQRFEYYCKTREGKGPQRKIKEMIREYNRRGK